jgi:Flp pilus assembly protein TadG
MKTQLLKRLIYPKSRREWGQSIALMVVALPAFVGAVGLAMDIGNFYFNYYKTQTATDATVLAAVRYLPTTSAAQTAACAASSGADCTSSSYAAKNGITGGSTCPPQPGADCVTFPILNAGTIQMNVQRKVPYYFARLVGTDSGMVKVSATASIGPPSSINDTPCTGSCSPPSTLESNLVPIGLDNLAVSSYVAGQPVDMIFRGASDSGPQYWGGLIFGATGASAFANEIEYGFKYKLSVGDTVPPETGRKKGPTASAVQSRITLGASLYPSDSCTVGACTAGVNYQPGDPRAVIVPLVDWSSPSCCTITGFASVWLQGVGTGSACPGSADICGLWITTVSDGTINVGAPTYGSKIAKLQ